MGKPQRGMRRVCTVHADARADEVRATRSQLAAANAFLADTSSEWCKAVPMNERLARASEVRHGLE
jgi:hypothetical protein